MVPAVEGTGNGAGPRVTVGINVGLGVAAGVAVGVSMRSRRGGTVAEMVGWAKGEGTVLGLTVPPPQATMNSIDTDPTSIKKGLFMGTH